MKTSCISIVAAVALLAGCQTDPNKPMTHTQSGAMIGAIGGAVVGAMAY